MDGGLSLRRVTPRGEAPGRSCRFPGEVAMAPSVPGLPGWATGALAMLLAVVAVFFFTNGRMRTAT